MDFIKVQWFCCNFILQLHFLYIYIFFTCCNGSQYQFLKIYKYILITRDEFLMTYRFLLKPD